MPGVEGALLEQGFPLSLWSPSAPVSPTYTLFPIILLNSGRPPTILSSPDPRWTENLLLFPSLAIKDVPLLLVACALEGFPTKPLCVQYMIFPLY